MIPASQVALVVKNPSTNAWDMRDRGLMPGLGRSSGGRHGNPLQCSCLKNSHGQEPGRLQSIGSQRVGHDWSDWARMRACMYVCMPWSEVAQSCPTLCNPVDFSVHGILQARKLEWVTISFFRGSSQPRDRTQVSHIRGRRFNLWAIKPALSARENESNPEVSW